MSNDAVSMIDEAIADTFDESTEGSSDTSESNETSGGSGKNNLSEDGSNDDSGEDGGKVKEKGEGEEEEGEEGGKEEKGEGDGKPPKGEKVQKRKNKIQQEINDLTRQKYELKRENQRLKEQLSEDSDLPEKPDPKKFSSQREYDHAVGKWEAEVERINSEKEQAEDNRIKSEKDGYNEIIAKEKSKYPDFDSVKRNIAHIDITPELHDALVELPNKTDLVYFLAKNPRIAEETLSLPSRKQSMRLAEISFKLAEAAKRKVKNVSDAPAPGSKLPKGGGSAKEKHPSEMTQAEYAQWRKKQT